MSIFENLKDFCKKGYEKCVEKYKTISNSNCHILSYKNDIILDPFMGAGTTAISCLKNNRFYLGSELDENYFNLSKNRINNYIK